MTFGRCSQIVQMRCVKRFWKNAIARVVEWAIVKECHSEGYWIGGFPFEHLLLFTSNGHGKCFAVPKPGANGSFSCDLFAGPGQNVSASFGSRFWRGATPFGGILWPRVLHWAASKTEWGPNMNPEFEFASKCYLPWIEIEKIRLRGIYARFEFGLPI